jgi:signal transduction histidine kinase
VLESRLELGELCRRHGLDAAWVEDSRDLEDLLDRALAECERRSRDDGDAAVHALILVARRARSLQLSVAALPAGASSAETLERMGERVDGIRADRSRREELSELLGTLSKLCHAINNPLTALMGRAQLLQFKLARVERDAQVDRAVEVIGDSARRVAAAVQELAHVVGRAKERL